jgi:hypothetical protein
MRASLFPLSRILVPVPKCDKSYSSDNARKSTDDPPILDKQYIFLAHGTNYTLVTKHTNQPNDPPTCILILLFIVTLHLPNSSCQKEMMYSTISAISAAVGADNHVQTAPGTPVQPGEDQAAV